MKIDLKNVHIKIDLKKWLKRFRAEECGQDLIEYVLLASICSLGAVVSMHSLAGKIATAYGNVGTRFSTAIANAGGGGNGGNNNGGNNNGGNDNGGNDNGGNNNGGKDNGGKDNGGKNNGGKNNGGKNNGGNDNGGNNNGGN